MVLFLSYFSKASYPVLIPEPSRFHQQWNGLCNVSAVFPPHAVLIAHFFFFLGKKKNDIQQYLQKTLNGKKRNSRIEQCMFEPSCRQGEKELVY